MGLETATTLAGLDESYPLSGDDVNRGDDHFRLIKKVLKLVFPGELGDGFATAILANEAELNYLQGLSSNAQDQFDAVALRLDDLEGAMTAPIDTVLSFFQASAPAGWEQVVAHPDAMMRVVSGAGGGYKDDGHSAISNSVTVGPHIHTGIAQSNGDHTHTIFSKVAGTKYMSSHDSGTEALNSIVKPTSLNGAHPHTLTVDNADAVAWEPNYVDMILAIKVES